MTEHERACLAAKRCGYVEEAARQKTGLPMLAYVQRPGRVGQDLLILDDALTATDIVRIVGLLMGKLGDSFDLTNLAWKEMP